MKKDLEMEKQRQRRCNFHHGPHLHVYDRDVLGIAVKAALRTVIVKLESMSDVEEKDNGRRGRVERGKSTPVCTIKPLAWRVGEWDIGSRIEEDRKIITVRKVVQN